jgi:hypothetical protein
VEQRVSTEDSSGQLLGNIGSPYGLAAASYILFLVAWVFPPTLYTRLLKEQDLLFLDFSSLLFYTSCVATFCLGVWICRYMEGASYQGRPRAVMAANPVLFFLVPVGLLTILCVIFLIQLGGRIDVVGLLAASQGEAIKQTEEPGSAIEGRWDMVPPMLTAMLAWAYFRMRQMNLSGMSSVLCNIILLAGLLANLAIDIARVDRAQLMPLIIGMIAVYIYFKTRDSGASALRLSVMAFGAVIAVLGIFIMLSVSRGIQGVDSLLASLLGYTVVSYNRMAALMSGSMHYGFQSSGVYVLPFLSQSGGLNSIVPFSSVFGWPTARDLWRSEFISTAQAGLNPGFIWSGAFGYLFSDLGWYTVVYLFFYGLFCGYCWVKFKNATTFGVVTYPWVIFSVLFWFGVNMLPYDRILNYFELFLILYFYDKWFLYEPDPE